MTLAEMFTRLKTAVGGNREKQQYEDTFGMPLEEKQYITMPNPWNRRILGELEFALRLSAQQDNAFDPCIREALQYLSAQMEQQGVLTNDSCAHAEELLLPCREASREYEIILAAHAHIDMNWTWGYHETVAIVLNTFRTMLDIMNEYPDFHFSQSQAAVFQIVEEYDPEMMKEIQARIREGRWELTASTWVEMDKNMPNTESLIHQTRCAREYLQQHWGIDPASIEVDFSPDTFGHPRHQPEIDGVNGLKYYYFCRGLEEPCALFRWRAPSGKEVLAYREQYWYNSAITPHIGVGLLDISRRSAGLKTGLIVYGVGDHGGGPTRRDVERAIDMMGWPIFPRLRFGSIHEFFHIAESKWDEYPLIDHHMNYTAPGCLTTQSRIKMGNRQAERALYESELWSALSPQPSGAAWRYGRFAEAWKKVLFNQFHDILTGSCKELSRECAMSTYSEALAIAHTEQNRACRAIAEEIDTSFALTDEDCADTRETGAGPGYGFSGGSDFLGQPVTERGMGMTRVYHLFNSTSREKRETAELTLWDWAGDLHRLAAYTPDGTELPLQLLDQERKWYWDHMYLRVLVDVTVPALGYTTLVLRQKEAEEYPFYYHTSSSISYPYENPVLENEYLRAEFDFRTGGLVSLTDRETGCELVHSAQGGRLCSIRTEYVSSNGWHIGRYLGSDEVETLRIRTEHTGPLRQGFVVEQRLGDARMETAVSLDAHARAVRYHLKLDWPEHGREGEPKPAPVLSFVLPLAYPSNECLRDIPAGADIQPAQQNDIPGLQYAAALNPGGSSLFLAADSKYGYRLAEDRLSVSLINTSHSPDPYSDYGLHEVTLFVGASTACPQKLEETVTGLHHPITYLSVRAHAGSRPAEGSLLQMESPTAILSSLSMDQQGNLLACCYETCGEETPVSLRLPAAVVSARFVDAMGNPVEGDLSVEGDTLRAVLPRHSLRILQIRLAR